METELGMEMEEQVAWEDSAMALGMGEPEDSAETVLQTRSPLFLLRRFLSLPSLLRKRSQRAVGWED